MEVSAEFLDIPICPLCGSRHRYQLDVERATVMQMITLSQTLEQPRKVRVTRLFTCPAKSEDFQATIVLTDTSTNRIKSVSVGKAGADDGATDESK